MAHPDFLPDKYIWSVKTTFNTSLLTNENTEYYFYGPYCHLKRVVFQFDTLCQRVDMGFWGQ